MNNGYAVILAGGRGERFWPLSTPERPKQFLTLFGGVTLLAQAVQRLQGLIPPERVIVITSQDLVPLTQREVPELPAENIIGEPCGRDTAAACALACALVEQRDPHGVVAILTADQIMSDVAAFRQTLGDAIAVASTHDVIVTLGIVPTAPATGFGYIKVAEPFAVGVATPFSRVERFVEKPNLATAQRYLDDGGYCWNAGMFIWRVAVMRHALAQFVPHLEALCQRIVEAPRTAVAATIAAIYPGLPRISVDYAIMEHATNLVMAHGDFGWDDVGSWSALPHHLPVRTDGNVVVGNCDACDAVGNVVVAPNNRHVALLGVSDLIVVQHENTTLVCHKDRAQDLKALLKQMADSTPQNDDNK